jgi:hypothetical protein
MVATHLLHHLLHKAVVAAAVVHLQQKLAVQTAVLAAGQQVTQVVILEQLALECQAKVMLVAQSIKAQAAAVVQVQSAEQAPIYLFLQQAEQVLATA